MYAEWSIQFQPSIRGLWLSINRWPLFPPPLVVYLAARRPVVLVGWIKLYPHTHVRSVDQYAMKHFSTSVITVFHLSVIGEGEEEEKEDEENFLSSLDTASTDYFCDDDSRCS